MTAPRGTALVTGAQRGIGRAIALRAGALGFPVAVNYMEQAGEAEAVRDEIVAAGGTAMTVRADVASVAQIDAMVAEVEQTLGPLEVLVNNAGVFPRRDFLDLTEDLWDQILDVNLKGTCFASLASARSMIRFSKTGP